MPSKKRSGPWSRKTKKQKSRAQARTRARSMTPHSTREPFEQDSKRHIGQHTDAGEPPLMKK
jgi:hypothetical protein